MSKFLKCIVFILLFKNIIAAQAGEAHTPLEDRWALVIGISQYRDNTHNLKFADKDGDVISDVLINRCRFPQNHIKLLKNADATYDNIRRGIEGWLAKNTNKNDKVVIFFSGHGTQDLDDNNDELDGYDEFLVPYDFDDTDISSAIRDDMFSYWINNLKSENVLILFDSCYSGGAAKAKGFNHIKVKGRVLVDGFIKDIFKEVPKAGVALLAACKDNQYSFEAPEFGMGLFTYSLINSFKQNNDLDDDQSLDVNELFAPTNKFVIDYSIRTYKEEQTPVLISTLKLPFKLVYIPQAKPVTPDKFIQESKNMYFQAIRVRDKQRKIELLEQAIKYDPHNYFAYELLAYTFLELGESEKAIHYYELALVDSPIKEHLYVDLSKAYEQLGNFRLAFQHIKLALDISENTQNLNQLARLYALNSDYNNAIKYYLKSIEVNPRDDEAHFELARVYIQQEEYDQALSVLSAAININPDCENFYYLKGILMCYVKNNLNEGGVLYKKYSEMDESFPEIISAFKYDKKRWVATFSSLVKRNEYIAEYYMCAILSYEENKDTNKAKEYSERLKRAYPFFKDAAIYKELQHQIK